MSEMSVEDYSPIEVSARLDAVVEQKSRRSTQELLLFGMLAGIYIGFGAIASTTVLSYEGLPAAVSKWLAGSMFCVGLILVIVPGSELFTGNVLMAAGLVSRQVPLRLVLRNWLLVYLGNFVGALLLALVMYGTGLLGTAADPNEVGQAAAKIASAKIDLAFGPALLRGVLCNILVCLAVILAMSARTVAGKIAGIYFPITVFVLSGFEHSIANMYFLPAGLLASGRFVGGFFSMFYNLVPVTLGNILGGLVVILLHPARARKVAQTIGERLTGTRRAQPAAPPPSEAERPGPVGSGDSGCPPRRTP